MSLRPTPTPKSPKATAITGHLQILPAITVRPHKSTLSAAPALCYTPNSTLFFTSPFAFNSDLGHRPQSPESALIPASLL